MIKKVNLITKQITYRGYTMKYLKYLLIILLIFSFAMVSCKKDSTTGPAGGSIVGTWNVVDAVVGWLITTNSNQTATNMFDVTGQITITGAHTVTMDFVFVDYDTDPPSFMLSNMNDDNGNYTLLLDGTTGRGMLFANAQTFLGDVTFAYNNGTLTITQSTITDVSSAATVTISGTLSLSQTNISANTPTLIQFPGGFGDGGDIGLTTVKFNSDETATVTDVYEGGTDTENWTYITDGNQITITDEFGDTIVFEYSIVGNTLTLVASDFEDYCGDFVNQAECFQDTEELFNLTPGSITDVSMQVEFILNQAVAKQGLKVGKTYNLINPTKVITDYKLKIEKLKKSL
jgi:hypothetical protein